MPRFTGTRKPNTNTSVLGPLRFRRLSPSPWELAPWPHLRRSSNTPKHWSPSKHCHQCLAVCSELVLCTKGCGFLVSNGSDLPKTDFKGITESENSRRLWLFPGSFWGGPEETPGKSREIETNITRIGRCFTFQGHRERQTCHEPRVHTASNLAQTFRAGCFF